MQDWRAQYASGEIAPHKLLDILHLDSDDPAWISRLDEENLRSQLVDLQLRLDHEHGDLSRLPLYGIPFAVKDNIDVAGWQTTAACPEFAYVAQADAAVVQRLRAAGAIVVGKTNLDQFATGLVGTRSPYGAVPNAFRAEYISGGSSSGSASVVARGIVPFALGTDTAGSGRVPAGMNNLVGLKPTRGWLSTSGVVPACRTLDCVSVLALTVDDAEAVTAIAAGYDGSDPYARTASISAPLAMAEHPCFGVPRDPEFFGDADAALCFSRALQHLQSLRVKLIPVDFTPFSALAALLYEGPWIAERFAAVESLWRKNPEAIDPVVRQIIEGASGFTAADTYKAEYRRAALTRFVDAAMCNVDALVVPTAPTVFTIKEVLKNPVALNAQLGIYTNFANFADLCALALPAGMRKDGLPAGITLLAPAWHDRALAHFGRRWQAHLLTAEPDLHLGATGREPNFSSMTPLPTAENTVLLAVVGAHLRGMPLHHQLTTRGARFIAATETAAAYRLYALANSTPAKPGLARVSPGESGANIAVEVWELPLGNFGSFTAEIPAPLGIGSVTLRDGSTVRGFICEPAGLAGATDITAFGGWRAYLASRNGKT